MAEEDLIPEDPQEADPLTQQYDAIIKKRKATAPMRVASDVAKDIKPPAGEIIQLSKKTGLDRDSIKDDFDSVKKTAAQPTDKEYQQLLEQAPKVSKWLEDPYNAKATENDRPKLIKLEQSLAHEDPLLRPRSDEEVIRRAEIAAQRSYDTLVSEEGKIYNSMEGPITGPTRTPEERAKLKLRLITEEIAKQREQEKFIASTEPLTAGHLWEENPLTGIPFLSAVPKLAESDLLSLRSVRNSPEDQDILLQQKRLEAAAARRGKTWGAYFAGMGTGLTEFAGEMMLAPEVKAAQGAGFFTKALMKLANIGGKTLTQLPKIAAATKEFGTPETTVTQDENGELQLEVSSGGQTYAVPFAKAVGSSLIDVAATELPFHPLYKLWAKSAAEPTVANFVKQYAKGGVESMVGMLAINDAAKLAKEIVGIGGPVEMPDTFKALMGDKEALKRVSAAAAAGGVAGLGGVALQRKRAQAEEVHGQAISYRDWMKEASADVKEMEAHGKHPEVIADAIKEMVKDTPKEFTPVSLETFIDHYSKLGINPDEFAQELTGRPNAIAESKDSGILRIPTDQYLTKIGATDAGPVFEKAGANFDPLVPSVDAAKEYIANLGKEPEKATPDQAKLEEQVKALGESFRERAKAQGIDLAKYVEKGDTVKATKVAARLAASTETLQTAYENLGISEPLLSGLSPKDAEAYSRLRTDARDAAYEVMDKAALADINRQRTEQYKFQEQQVRDKLTKELEQLPEYRAMSIMKTGLDVNGDIVHEGGLKLDRDTVRELHGKEVLEALPKDILSPTKEAGNTPDDVAELLGYSSGDELILKLWKLEKLESVVDRRANEIMQTMNLSDLAELPEKAKEALHNDENLKVKAFELKWLIQHKFPEMKDLLKKVSNFKTYIKEMRDYAVEEIGKKSDRVNSPADYEAAERKAEREGRDAALSGNIPEAIKQLQIGIKNHELWRESKAAKKDAKRIREYAAEFSGSEKRKLMYAAGEQYLTQSDALLERFSFKNRSGAKLDALASLKEFTENEANAGYISQIPEKLLREAYRENWKDVPISDLRDIEATLKQLENNAELKQGYLLGNELKKRGIIAQEVSDAIKANKKRLYRDPNVDTPENNALPEKPLDSYTAEENQKRDIKDLGLSPRNDASIFREMDGFKDGGPLQQYVLRPRNEAGAKEAGMIEKSLLALDRIYGKFSNLERFQMHRKKYIPEINGSLNDWQRMEIAALMKQEGAKQRLRDGNGWGEAQLDAITKGFTDKQKTWVTDILEHLDSFKEDVKAQIERRTGLPAKLVKDYFPFKYDARTDVQAAKQLDIQEAKMSMQAAGVQSQTKHGYTETRVENVKGKRLRFDSGVLFEHIREVVHDIAWSETLRDQSALLGSKEVSNAIKDHYGDQVYRQLTKSLHDIAVGDKPAASVYEKFMNWLRHGTTISGLGWSFMQAATDPTGISQGASRIGLKWMAVGGKKVLGDAVHLENAVKEMWDNSEVMRLRGKTSMRELYEVKNKIEAKGKAALLADFGLNSLTAGKLDAKDISDSYYSMMTKIQIAQEAPLWWGAFEKAKAEKPSADHATLVSMADQAVLDTYGGGQIKDLPPLLKGDVTKKMIFGTFYSFASRTFNLALESGIRYGRAPKTVASFGRLLSDYMLLYAAPAAVMFGIKRLLTQNDKDLVKGLLQAEAGYAIGSVPYLNQLESTVQGRDYSGPAGMRFFSAMAGVGKNAFQGKADWHDMNTAAGILFHYPALQVQRFFDGMESWLDKGNGTPLSPLFGPPPKRR